MKQLLRLECVTKTENNIAIIENMDLTIEKDTMVGVVGKTYHQASTFLRLLSGDETPCSGKIFYGKEELGVYGQVPQQVGVYISEIGFLPEFTGFKNLKYIAGMNEIATEEDILSSMNLIGLSSNNRKRVMYYTRRMIHKLSLTQAIMEGQQILLLDAGLFTDKEKEHHAEMRKILQTLRQKGISIIVAAEHADYVKNLCDQIIYL